MASQFRAEVHYEGETAVVALSGELDLASAASFERTLEEIAGYPAVVLDLEDLEFIDSTGLTCLVKAHQRAQDAGQSLTLLRPDAQARRLLKLTGLDERLTIAGLDDVARSD
ncbi:MAG: STAS domain-containing protein [Solirubrobacteraceae bacterium]